MSKTTKTPQDKTISKAKQQQKQAEKLKASEFRVQENELGRPVVDIVAAQSVSHSHTARASVQNPQSELPAAQSTEHISHPVLTQHDVAAPVFIGKVVPQNNSDHTQFQHSQVVTPHGVVEVHSNGVFQVFSVGPTLVSGSAPILVHQMVDGHAVGHSFTMVKSGAGISIISGDTAAVVTEDVAVQAGQLVASGVLVESATSLKGFNDSDLQGVYGHFQLDKQGHWQYSANDLDPRIQALKLGETLTEVVPASSNSGWNHDITIVIRGTEDKAIISGAGVGHVIEDTDVQAGNLHTKGQFNITDSDHDDAFFRPLNVSAQHGEFTMDEDGHWSFSVLDSDKAIQQLGVGESFSETFAVTSKDGGTSHDVVVTISGINDVPVLSVVQNDHTAGTLNTADIDTTDTHTYGISGGTTSGQSVVAKGTFGDLTLDPKTGDYHYTLHADAIHQGMNYNAKTHTYTGHDTFEVSTDDHHGGVDTKFITFDPTATITAPTSAGGHPTVTTTVPTITGVSTSALITPTLTPAQPTVTLTGLTPNTDTGSSNTDGITSNSKPTVVGHTDIPYSYVDITDGVGKVVGSGYTDANGHFEIAIDLAKPTSFGGDTHHLSAKVTDPSGHDSHTTTDLPVVIDQSVNAPDATNTVTEDHQPSAAGELIPHAEHGDVVTAGDIQGQHGKFHLDQNGHYTYQLDNKAAQHLAEGEKITDHTPYTVTDVAGNTNTGDLTVTILGTNDKPVLSVAQTTHIAGTLQTADVDSKDSHTYGVKTGAASGQMVIATGTFGDLSLDPKTGDYHYTLHADAIHQGMSYDAKTYTYSGQDTFEVSTDDHHGGVDTKFITFEPTATLSKPSTTGGQPTVTTTVPTPTNVSNTAPTVPTQSPAQPTVTLTGLTSATDTGSSNTDGITFNATPTVVGHTDIPFSHVDITDGTGKVVGSGYTDGKGHFEIQVDLGSSISTGGDTHNLGAKVTDPSGHDGQTVTGLPVVVDQHTVASVVITDGANLDGVINNVEQSKAHITGTIEAGAHLDSLVVTDSQGHSVTVDTSHVKVKSDGSFELNVELTKANGESGAASQLVDGDLSVAIHSTDIAGNSTDATSAHIQLDTTTAVPTLNGLANPTHNSNNTPPITGSAEPNAIVTIKDNGAVIATVTADKTGDFSFTPSKPLPDGDHSFTASAIDTAGNHSKDSQPLITHIDASIEAPKVTLTDGNHSDSINATEQAHATLSGELTDIVIDSTTKVTEVVITDSAHKQVVLTPQQLATLNGNVDHQTGHFNLTDVDLTSLTDGDLTVTLTATDAAGNHKDGSATAHLDTTISKPVVDLTNGSDSAGANTAGTDTDNLTKDTNPTFTLGSIDPDAQSVEVFI
ncbi:VCBS domain-containing protein, partial [Vibrio sp. UCD-FRSSP16_10]